MNAFPLERLWSRWLDPTSGAWARGLAKLRLQNKDKEDLVKTEDPTSLPLAIDLQQELTIAAPRRQVFHSITQECSTWWPAEFRSTRALELHLDATLGGHFWEDWGSGGGAQLAMVTRIVPDELLELSGPLHLGLLLSKTTFALEDFEEGTLLRFAQRAFGDADPDVAKHSAPGWNKILNALRQHTEGEHRAD